MKTALNKTIEQVRLFLESTIAIPVLFDVMFLLWIFNLTYVSVFIMALIVAAIFLLCKNVKNAFVPIVYISFFLNDIAVEANILLYGIAVGVAVASMVTFLILKLVKERKTIKKGNFFWPFVVMTIAFLLGGCIGHFNIVAFFALLGFCLLAYFFYWLVLNFCEEFTKFIFYLMLYGGIYIILVMFVSNLGSGDFYYSVVDRKIMWIGSQHINTAALFIVFGIIGALVVGYKKKTDYLYFALALVMFLFLLLTFCRLMVLLGLLSFIGLIVIMLLKSKKKMNFVWVTLTGAVVLAALCAINWDRLEYMIRTIVWRIESGSSGREILWPWCWDKFIKSPIFGIGFVSAEPVPTVRNVVQLVLAHNTILQWLTSLGVVGSLLMVYFYIKKYQIIFTKPLMSKLFLIITLVVIELNGMLDQTAAMDIFVEVLTFMLIAACERETPNVNRLQLLIYKKKRANKS